jgi:hypothetical protein
MPRYAAPLTRGEADAGFARETLDVDDLAECDRVAAVLGLEPERSRSRSCAERALQLLGLRRGHEHRQHLAAVEGDLDPDALVGHELAMLELGAEQPLVGGDGLVEVGHGNAEMVNSARLHAGDGIESVRCYYANRADGLRGARLGLDSSEQLRELVLVERLLVEQGERDAV